MGKSKRRLLITAIIVVPLVTLFIVWAFVDAPPPDDSDLQIAYEDIPDEENAFTYFDQAVEGVYWPEDQEERRRAASLLSEDGWDDALAAQILAENGGFFDTIEQGLDCPRFQVPEIKDLSVNRNHLSEGDQCAGQLDQRLV